MGNNWPSIDSSVEKLGKFYLKDQCKDVASFFDNNRKDNYMYKF